jgi:hypothetical protein
MLGCVQSAVKKALALVIYEHLLACQLCIIGSK